MPVVYVISKLDHTPIAQATVTREVKALWLFWYVINTERTDSGGRVEFPAMVGFLPERVHASFGIYQSDYVQYTPDTLGNYPDIYLEIDLQTIPPNPPPPTNPIDIVPQIITLVVVVVLAILVINFLPVIKKVVKLK